MKSRDEPPNQPKNNPKINPKSTKMAPKSVLEAVLGASWGFLGALGPQDHPKTPPRAFQARKGEESGVPPRAPFWKDFGAMLAPRATKRPVKKHTKISLIWKSIFHRFSWILLVFRGSGGSKFASLKKQPAAPIETFARFQAFHGFSRISSIFMDFDSFSWIWWQKVCQP